MTQARSRRRPRRNTESSSDHSSTHSHSSHSDSAHSSSKPAHERSRTLRERLNRERTEHPTHRSPRSSAAANLSNLIEHDAPLQAHNVLVLMYGPFQAEMVPQAGQGVASWLTECVRKHGIPSLLRFDYHRRAQIFRRDQFQNWLEPLMQKASG